MQRPAPTPLRSQQDIVAALVAIFPDFGTTWDEDEADGGSLGDSQHSVYMSFLPFIARATTTTTQLTQLAWLLGDAVAAGGDAENAVDTAFFEAIRRYDPLGRKLRPLLDPAAKGYLR